MSGVKRNPRQISSARLESAINYNRKWAKHFSNIYSYPDYSELESIGLEAIMRCVSNVRKTQRQKGFVTMCRVCVHNAVVNHIKRTGKQAAVLSKARRKAALITRDNDKYMPDSHNDE